MSFDSGSLYLDINQALLPKNSAKRPFDETGLLELLAELKQGRAEGKPNVDAESELHKRLSIPFACLIFGLIGAPLGIRKSRSGKSAGIALSLIVFLVYYILLASGRNLAEAGTLTPGAAYWIPNAVMAVAAVVLAVMKGREIEFSIIDRVARLGRWLWSSSKKAP